MSASLGPKHHINVFSDPDVIRKQIRSAVTDSGETLVAGQLSPGVENLFSLLDAAGGKEASTSLRNDANNGSLQYGKLKDQVADHIISLTQPFRDNRVSITENKKAYQDKVSEASARIRQKASQTVHEVKELIGLLNVQ